MKISDVAGRSKTSPRGVTFESNKYGGAGDQLSMKRDDITVDIDIGLNVEDQNPVNYEEAGTVVNLK